MIHNKGVLKAKDFVSILPMASGWSGAGGCF